MGVIWITPTEITPGSTGWQDADVSGNVPAGATGVILHIFTTDYFNVGWRKNGSTDNRVSQVWGPTHIGVAIGVDGDRILEIYVAHTTNCDVWLIGYLNTESSFFTNAFDKSFNTPLDEFVDIDISGDTSGDTAIGAFLDIIDVGNYEVGLRKNGSTDNRAIAFARHIGGVIGVDGSEIFEAEINNTTVDIFLVGYIKSEATFIINATDVSLGSISSWIDLTALPAGATGGFYDIIATSTSYFYGLRKNGSSEDITGKAGGRLHCFGMVECDGSRIVEGWINNTGVDFFVVGYSTAAGAALFASIADTVGIIDDINTQVVNARNIFDNIGITDVLSKIGTYIRTLADNLASTDTINTARNLKKSMADDIGITDILTGSVFKLVNLADTIGIIDILSRTGTFIRNIPDTIGITDAITTIKTFARSIADTVGITDIIASKKFVLVALADTVGITDVLSKIGTFIRSIPDNIGITDVLTKIGTYKRSITDTTGITDTTTVSKGVFRSLSDTIGITDIISTIIGKLSSIADTIGITDVITFIKTTVVGGRVFIAGIAKSLRISGKKKSLTVSGEDKSLKISGSGD